jgi:hypothetical protein
MKLQTRLPLSTVADTPLIGLAPSEQLIRGTLSASTWRKAWTICTWANRPYFKVVRLSVS